VCPGGGVCETKQFGIVRVKIKRVLIVVRGECGAEHKVGGRSLHRSNDHKEGAYDVSMRSLVRASYTECLISGVVVRRGKEGGEIFTAFQIPRESV